MFAVASVEFQFRVAGLQILAGFSARFGVQRSYSFRQAIQRFPAETDWRERVAFASAGLSERL